MKTKEIWKDVPVGTQTGPWWEVANYYEASSLGRIRNKKTGNILWPTFSRGNCLTGEQPHLWVNVDCPRWKRQRIHVRVSHLVWAAFTGQPVSNVRIYHLDGDISNNAFYNLADYNHLKHLGLR